MLLVGPIGRGRTKHTILSNITTVFVDVLKLPQCLDDEEILPRPCHNQLGPLVEAVVEDLERFEYVAPVLALVVESLIEHIHHLVEVGRAIEAVSTGPAKTERSSYLLNVI
jgi:hypothetical protein